MTFTEMRNMIVKLLYDAMEGPKVVLSDQQMPEEDYPYFYYQIVVPRIPGVYELVLEKTDDAAAQLHRVEQPTATISFAACSMDRAGISGEDEALYWAEKAQGFFLHTGRELLKAAGIVVVDVTDARSRSAIEFIETDRRWGFDVAVRYERKDSRELPVMAGPAILIQED